MKMTKTNQALAKAIYILSKEQIKIEDIEKMTKAQAEQLFYELRLRA